MPTSDVSYLLKKVSKLINIESQDLILTDLYHSRIYQKFGDEFKLNELEPNDKLILYELPSLYKKQHKKIQPKIKDIPKCDYVEIENNTILKFKTFYKGDIKHVLFLLPFFSKLPLGDSPYHKIEFLLLKKIYYFFTKDIFKQLKNIINQEIEKLLSLDFFQKKKIQQIYSQRQNKFQLNFLSKQFTKINNNGLVDFITEYNNYLLLNLININENILKEKKKLNVNFFKNYSNKYFPLFHIIELHPNTTSIKKIHNPFQNTNDTVGGHMYIEAGMGTDIKISKNTVLSLEWNQNLFFETDPIIQYKNFVLIDKDPIYNNFQSKFQQFSPTIKQVKKINEMNQCNEKVKNPKNKTRGQSHLIPIKLEECIDYLSIFKKTKLKMYHCNKCNGKEYPFTSKQINSTSPIIIFQLKYLYKNTKKKNLRKIKLPLELNLHDDKYYLFSFGFCKGNSPDYCWVCKNYLNGEWYQFSPNKVELIKNIDQRLITHTSFAFYEKKLNDDPDHLKKLIKNFSYLGCFNKERKILGRSWKY
ncbi:ubiquitin carboxyl-terminal hydrolase [Anaeramoeba flamelloides]|uniref:Ubiquitin carboxyl-terminal hydrolase n=1 Tax=Anaeramoeba flamelloides TaxID=1746091 RepID=A0ABQ8XDA8_9EUKA|nr:ubiquitin carboxyl-terminal hydrolase [Anaeramoeba flamelloides]